MSLAEPSGNARHYGEHIRDILAAYAGNAMSSGAGGLASGNTAIHVISGPVTWQSWWRFSTSDLIDELERTEQDDCISSHLIVIDSPGGEVYGVHEAWQAIRSCKKPVYALCREYCASAAYWIASACKKIYVESPLTTVGCIGVMAMMADWSGFEEKEGIRVIELYAHGSPDKNKLSRDVLSGDTEEYITKRLDPVLAVMLDDIKAGRRMKDDNAALTGKVYYAEEAESLSLIDGVSSISDVLSSIEPPVPPTTDINNLNLFQ